MTKPSPEQQISSGVSLGLRPENSTLVHVLVHRESDEYKEEEESSHVSPAGSIKGKFFMEYFD